MDTVIEPQKKVYTTPTFIIYGGVEVITQGNSNGKFTDAAFAAGTNFEDITFSG
jgi:hypothetical protein